MPIAKKHLARSLAEAEKKLTGSNGHAPGYELAVRRDNIFLVVRTRTARRDHLIPARLETRLRETVSLDVAGHEKRWHPNPVYYQMCGGPLMDMAAILHHQSDQLCWAPSHRLRPRLKITGRRAHQLGFRFPAKLRPLRVGRCDPYFGHFCLLRMAPQLQLGHPVRRAQSTITPN